MTLTSTDKATPSSKTDRAVPSGTCPDSLVRAIRSEVCRGLDWQQTADRVVGALRTNLPDPAVLLSLSLRRGDPACYQSHLLYAEPDGSFSVSAMVWLPGQQTVIHDHVAWCVTGVLQGHEYEEVFALTADGSTLTLGVRNLNPPGPCPASPRPVTSTGSATPVTTWPSPCTYTARTSPAWATASAASTPSPSAPDGEACGLQGPLRSVWPAWCVAAGPMEHRAAYHRPAVTSGRPGTPGLLRG
jgi:hypothetical protein